MAKRRRPTQAAVVLEVRVMFEPHRLAQDCLERAYARVVPTPRRRTTPRPGPGMDTLGSAAPTQQPGGGGR